MAILNHFFQINKEAHFLTDIHISCLETLLYHSYSQKYIIKENSAYIVIYLTIINSSIPIILSPLFKSCSLAFTSKT
jgi:hypothetical protein